MRDAGHMDTYDARYEATEKAEATVQEKFPRQSARSGKRRSWKLPLFRKRLLPWRKRRQRKRNHPPEK
mgnify:FL=1